MLKTCPKCKVNKKISCFYKSTSTKDGLYSYCKECHKSCFVNNPARRKRYKTCQYVLSSRWLGIVNRHKHAGYENIKVFMTRQQFMTQMDNNQLKKLYKNWVESNYDIRLSPTIDRINPRGHYSLSNIRWLTFSENCSRGGQNPNRAIPVKQYTKDNVFVKSYSSATEAAKQLVGKVEACSNIRQCVNGKIKSAYGYVWKQ